MSSTKEERPLFISSYHFRVKCLSHLISYFSEDDVLATARVVNVWGVDRARSDHANPCPEDRGEPLGPDDVPVSGARDRQPRKPPVGPRWGKKEHGVGHLGGPPRDDKENARCASAHGHGRSWKVVWKHDDDKTPRRLCPFAFPPV